MNLWRLFAGNGLCAVATQNRIEKARSIRARDPVAHMTTMNVIPKSVRISINRAARDEAIRYEMELRDKWTAELSDAMQRRVGYEELQALITRMETDEILGM